MQFYAHALDPETFGDLAEYLRRFKCALVEVEDGLALRADEMMMRFDGGIYANGAVMQTEFPQNAAFDEGMKRLVNGCERNTGNLLADYIVNFFRTWVAGSRHQRVVNDSALMGDG
jgi:hypothetical protein